MTLLLGVLVASLVGSVHCAAMCGGFVCLYAVPGRRLADAQSHAAYNAGRLVSYVTLGLLAGALGARIDRAGSLARIERGAAIVAGTLMVIWACALVATTLGARLSATGAPEWAKRRFGAVLLALGDQPPAVRAAAMGLLTTLLPCGWLYTFVVTAGGTGDPIAGAAVMFTFWAGTLPMMLGVGFGLQRIGRPLARHLPLASAALVFTLGALSIAGKLRPLSTHAHAAHVGRYVVATLPSAALALPVELCSHCRLPVPSGLVNDGAEHQFCCAGCHTAFDILHTHGLDRYYDLSERRAEAVRSTGRAYDEFDHPTFHELYVRPLPGGLAEVELYLEGVHCGSCVWLVERVPLVVKGVSRAELELRRSLARVVWNPAAVPLSQVARALDSLGYPPHPFRGVAREALRRRDDRSMLARIGLAGAVAVNVMLAALALYSGSSTSGGMSHEYVRFFRWVSFALVTPSMFWPARVFFVGGWSALRTRTLNMDVPIALGLAAGYVRGAINTVQDSGPVYFDGLATLIFALLVGRYLQQRGQRAAADGAELLYSLTPSSARVVDANGTERDVPAEAIVPDTMLSVRPGETFPADGIVTAGRSQLNVSLLTGESRPVSVGEGERVFAGTLNVSAPLTVRVEQAGETTRVAKILKQVEESAARRAPIVETANKLAAWFVAAVLVLAVATFAAWYSTSPTRALDNAIALLVVTCPCALALSTPLAVSMAIGGAARAGIFIKGGDALERLATPGRIFLDKTGTITEGRTAVVEWNGPDWVRPLVLSLESESTHPIAAGFMSAWPDVSFERATESTHVPGGGIIGRVDGHELVVGSPRFVLDVVPRAPRDLGPRAPTLTPVLVAVDGRIVATAGLGDPIRADSAEAVAALRNQGWAVEILSGDSPTVVAAAGQALGLRAAACTGAASPEAKLAAIESARGRATVVMVGDGINDAAAIAAASVGIGVHGGAEACLATADIYLTTPGLAPVVDLVTGARRAMRIIRRNIAFSVLYNSVGAGLAMAGVLSPLVAAVLMPASSLTVVLASWRGRAFRGRAS